MTDRIIERRQDSFARYYCPGCRMQFDCIECPEIIGLVDPDLSGLEGGYSGGGFHFEIERECPECHGTQYLLPPRTVRIEMTPELEERIARVMLSKLDEYGDPTPYVTARVILDALKADKFWEEIE